MYSIEELANYISLEEIPSSWNNCFNYISNKYQPNWLNCFDFNEILEYYEFDDAFKNRVKQEIELLNNDTKLNFICYIFYYILFYADYKNYCNIWSWKSTINVFNNNGSYTISVIALLCGYEIHIKNMKFRKFDNNQIELQKYNIRLTCTNDRKKHNIDGIRFSQMIWGSLFIKGNLIQIGRLQYEIDDHNFDKLDKYCKEKYKCIFMHIPRGKDLKGKDVNDSINNADNYIKKYYPELKTEKLVYYTQSWLLSPEVKAILPNDSNIVKFQNKFNIVKYEENIIDFLDFVFNEPLENVNYNNLQETTTLQRGLKQMIIDKKSLHLGLGILL